MSISKTNRIYHYKNKICMLHKATYLCSHTTFSFQILNTCMFPHHLCLCKSIIMLTYFCCLQYKFSNPFMSTIVGNASLCYIRIPEAVDLFCWLITVLSIKYCADDYSHLPHLLNWTHFNYRHKSSGKCACSNIIVMVMNNLNKSVATLLLNVHI